MDSKELAIQGFSILALILLAGSALAAEGTESDRDALFEELERMENGGAETNAAEPEVEKAEPRATESGPAGEPAEPAEDGEPETTEPAPAKEAETSAAESRPDELDEDAAEDIRSFVRMARDRAQEREERREEIRRQVEAQKAKPVVRKRPRRQKTRRACPHNRAVCSPLGLGLEVHGAAGPTRDNRLEGIGTGGFRLSLTLARFLTVGIGQIGGGESTVLGGQRVGGNAAPYAELFLFPSRNLQVYADVGAALQRRFGAGLPPTGGVAAFVGTGVRFWLGSRLTLSPSLRLFHVAKGGYLMSRRILPKGANVVTIGAAMGLHLF